MEQGILLPEQVEKLQKELALDGFETMSALIGREDSIPSESSGRIARFGRYVQLEFLGQGGMARVYKAFDPSLGRTVALKFVKVEDPKLAHRLLLEARSQARVEQEHVCKIYEAGEVEGKPYIAMQYISGKTLKESQELSLKQKVQVMKQVAEGVHAAHKAGLIHRDLKPANILIEYRETVPVAYVMDFGLARESQGSSVTMTGLVVGTPSYMSPEQVREEKDKLDARTDIYSMGATLYEVITGRPPFEGTNGTEILMQVIERDPVSPRKIDPNLPRDLETIIMKCLEKDPGRRYSTARALSEDLSRFLDGDPILGRSSSWLYQANKKIRKHPVVSGFAAIAFLAVSIFAAIAMIIQWRANQQAKFLQEFGHEAARMEGIMRFAYMLPLHNTSAERKIVQNRIHAIHSRMAELGRNAQGPGNYAMGRGFMALQKYEDAQKYFKRAVEDYDHKTSELYYSYGLTLAMLYQNELQLAARINSPQLREMRLKEIQTDLKVPALSYIREGRRSAEYSEYAEAVVQFLDEHYEQAIQRSTKALQQIPWLYEAKRLEGESYRNLGWKLLDQGNLSDALHAFDKGEKAFEISIQMGASDARGYEAACSLEGHILWLEYQTGGSGERPYATGKDFCEKAIRADPGSADSYMHLSRLHREYAGFPFNRENEIRKRALLEEALRTAQLSVQLRPDSVQTHATLVIANYALADFFTFKLLDPGKLIASGERSVEKAIQINPNDASVYYVGGQLLWMQSQYMTMTGEDPRKVIGRAIKYMETSIRLNPKDYKPYHVMGNILFARGEYEAEAGINPTESLDSAVKMIEKGLKMNPALTGMNFSLGYASFIKGKYLCLVGREPYEAISKAEFAFKEVLRINPKNAYAYELLGEASSQKAEFSLQTKTDPSAYLKEAREAAENCLALSPNRLGCFRILGEGKLFTARWKMLRRDPPDAEFRSSVTWLNRSIDTNEKGRSLSGYQSKARLFRWWAEWKTQSRQSADREILLGSEMVSKALEGNPRSGEMIALRGVFSLLRARSLAKDSHREELIRTAQSSLQEALRVNANLSHAFAPYLKEAEALIHSH